VGETHTQGPLQVEWESFKFLHTQKPEPNYLGGDGKEVMLIYVKTQ